MDENFKFNLAQERSNDLELVASNLEAILNACNSGDINGKVVKVISNKPDAFGLVRARKFNISTKIIDHTDFASRAEFDDYLNYYLDKLEPDLVVLAGGKGSRIKSLLNKKAKPMDTFNKKPFLEYIIQNYCKYHYQYQTADPHLLLISKYYFWFLVFQKLILIFL